MNAETRARSDSHDGFETLRTNEVPSQVVVQLSEILIRYKQAAFLSTSTKVTVPVLDLLNGTVIEESRDIMMWALGANDPDGWLDIWQKQPDKAKTFLDNVDGPFKHDLDRYKYASRYEVSAARQHRENGAQFLDLGQRGLKGKTEFFYRRGDGSSLYATRDIAYHRWKWTQCNELINVLGEDHRLQAQQVGLTLEELGERRPEVMFYSFIKLPEGKMSTRRGNVVFMDDLLEEAHAHAVEVLKERRPDLLSLIHI